jgi:hypothetical protein
MLFLGESAHRRFPLMSLQWTVHRSRLGEERHKSYVSHDPFVNAHAHRNIHPRTTPNREP